MCHGQGVETLETRSGARGTEARRAREAVRRECDLYVERRRWYVKGCASVVPGGGHLGCVLVGVDD